ncbi:MAG TPA: hypothetical protein VNM22_11975 [Candidatus Limnocylindrales bacterium]|nr:hypothetical protein [Candidatus Limnocylindrales bacterium]
MILHYLDKLKRFYDNIGFNLLGMASAEEYDTKAPPQAPRIRQLFPEARTVLIIGNGGSTFWQHYKNFLQKNPDFEQGRKDPFDDYTILVLAEGEKLLREAGFKTKTVYPFVREKVWLSFQQMAVLAGLGKVGKHGVLIHPEYGPWVSFRGAFLTDIPFNFEIPDRNFDPCKDCPAPCITVCPGRAVTDSGFNLSQCLETKLTHPICQQTCLSRFHCVYGTPYRFQDPELKFHARFTPEKARYLSSRWNKNRDETTAF